MGSIAFEKLVLDPSPLFSKRIQQYEPGASLFTLCTLGLIQTPY